jgi:hypothetical protein
MVEPEWQDGVDPAGYLFRLVHQFGVGLGVELRI